MSTRRPLGIGPTPTTTRSTATPAARLLPADRIQPGALLATPVGEQLPDRSGRRPLGTGPAACP
ncbi:hypothetical protein ACIP4W_41015 [Streptomyces sp. NPDC088846]|uniref:hypothetical protein n=1 Tax=Streptomyces sp. NPDC088846 TaxID=3365908 RepID=UPI0038052198